MPPAPSEQESIWMHFIASGSSIKISSLAHFHILVHFNDNTRCGTRQTMRPSRVKQRDNIWRKEKGTIYFSAYRARCLRVETSRQRQGMITRLLLKNVFFFSRMMTDTYWRVQWDSVSEFWRTCVEWADHCACSHMMPSGCSSVVRETRFIRTATPTSHSLIP